MLNMVFQLTKISSLEIDLCDPSHRSMDCARDGTGTGPDFRPTGLPVVTGRPAGDRSTYHIFSCFLCKNIQNI